MFTGAGFAVWATLATATLTPSPPNDRAVRALVERLGAADFRTREAAHRDLVALGDAARPALQRAADATDNPEIERRLEVLLDKLERERLIRPSRITLRGKYPVETILAQITRQTGYAFTNVSNDDKISMTVNWNAVPFWEALDEIANATGFSIQMNGDESGTVGFSNSDSHDPHVFRTGPYRIVATNIGTSTNRQLSGLPRRTSPYSAYGSTNLNLMIFSEPKNPMLAVGNPTIAKAEDDTGQSLAPAADESMRNFTSGYYGGGNPRGHSLYLYANLAKPHKDATRIKELRGTVPVSLLVGTRPELTIEKLVGMKKKTFVSRTTEVTIDSVGEPNDGGFSIALSAKMLQPNPDDYSWAGSFPQRLEVYDAVGRKYANAGTGVHQQAPGSTHVTVQFAPPEGKKLGPPAKLVLVEWIAATREIEFVFKDIPLP
jgi:hypothetical protein